jgi:hypothetical protein
MSRPPSRPPTHQRSAQAAGSHPYAAILRAFKSAKSPFFGSVMSADILATCLVDFFTVAEMRRGIHLVYTDYEEALFRVVRRLEASCQRLTPKPTDILCRLYGGWHSRTGQTDGYQLLSAAIRKNFPTKQTVRIRVNLATALLARPDIRIDNSLRSTPGLPRFVATVSPPACVSASTCTLKAVRRWQRGDCPESSCTVL